MAVQIAFAWISAPDMSSSPPIGVGWTSWSVGAEAPTTTIWPRITRAGHAPLLRRQTNETVSIVPGGPRKSIQALAVAEAAPRAGGCP